MVYKTAFASSSKKKSITMSFCFYFIKLMNSVCSALLWFYPICVWSSPVKTTIWLCSLECLKVQYIQSAVSCRGSLRRERIEATGLHLQQPVLPVVSGDTEVMDGAPQDEEGPSLQSELGRVGPQTFRAAHSSHFGVMSGGGGIKHNAKKSIFWSRFIRVG